MQPVGEDGCEDRGNPPTTGRDRAAPSHSSPPQPSTEIASEKKKQKHDHDDEQQAAVSLPEDALVEILSRVPYRSLRRFECVSKPWLALCSAMDIRKRSPQTLSGFFHVTIDGLRFRNLSGRGPPMVNPSLPFLRQSYKHIGVKQCCSSLLLCRCYDYESCPEEQECGDYVVCNPATERWVVLPPVVLTDGQLFSSHPNNIFLGFDTAAPSHFVVFAPLGICWDQVTEVAIYSSQTGRWNFVQSEWGNETNLLGNHECVFLNGIMHLTTHHSSLATVDAEGKVWRTIKFPDSTPNGSCGTGIASIGQSQGRLHAWQVRYHHDYQLYVWVLEDYDSGKWTLKHTVNIVELFGRHRKDIEYYMMFAIHPQCNLIFLTDGDEMTLSYDMDSQKVHVISTSEELLDAVPYTPCFAE